jgi:hypothetical protein
VRAHRLIGNPRQIADIRDERAIHPTEHTSARACTATADRRTPKARSRKQKPVD